MKQKENKFSNILSSFIVVLIIALLWCYTFGFFHTSEWSIPTGYGGDLYWVLSMAKSYMNNEVFPLFFKEIKFLNAPFVANWSDFPITEEIIFFSMGLLAKVSNIYFSHNIILLSGHCLAGLSFFLVAKQLNCKNYNSLAFAILFGLAHFLFARGSAHIILTYVFLIPVSLLILNDVLDQNIKIYDKKFKYYFIFSFLIGCFNPYYTFLFCIFLLFSFLFNFLKKKKNYTVPCLFIISSVLGFILMNADTFYSNFVNEVNLKAVGRNLAALEVYGMKMPELFLPPSGHRIDSFYNFGMTHYYHKAFVRGESWSSYMGFIGMIGFLTLIVNSLSSIRNGWNSLEIRSLISINWIFLYSLIGGINLILGVLNFQVFRAPNRFSIYIFCILLLYLCIKSSKIKSNILRYILISVMLFIGLFDQLPRPNFAFQDPIKVRVKSDIEMGKILMNELKEGGMVFQFPFREFPEVGPIRGMQDYEHLRPYINTKNIHFTYGNNKGRGSELWQDKIKFDNKGKFIKTLESYGFEAIYINKKAYEIKDKDNFLSLFEQLKYRKIFETNEVVIFKINGSNEPKDIPQENIFDHRWSKDEITHRWAKWPSAKITFFNCCNKYNNGLSFKIGAIDKGKYEIIINDKKILKGDFLNVGTFYDVKIDKEHLNYQKNNLIIKTNLKRTLASKTDSRLLTFSIKDFPR
tara:strand:+ start:6822 stop:8894 length:2073 start_codon:yes stop_codon:yes gene_type:complete